MYRIVGFCIADQYKDTARYFRSLSREMFDRASELDLHLDKQPILVDPRCRGLVVDLFIGRHEADVAASPDEPVRATGDDAPLRVVLDRCIRIQIVNACQPRHPCSP